MGNKRRSIQRLLSVFLATILSLTFLAGPTQAASPLATSVSLSASSVVPQKGSATLKGTVTYKKSKAVINKAGVVIQRKSGQTWIDVATVATDTKGAFRYVARSLTSDVTYRVVVKKSTKYTAATSASRRVVVQQTISISSTGPKTFTAGDKITVAGTVSPGLAMKDLTLQKSVNGSWTNLKTFPASAARKFSVTLPVYGAGAGQKLRVIGQNATPASWTVNVYGWYSLSQFQPIFKSGNFQTDPNVQLRGKTYLNSIDFTWSAGSFGGWSTGEAVYNLGYKCAKFESQVGVDDRSPGSLAAWNFTVSRDGVDSSTGFVSLGKDQKVTADLESVLRLRLSAVRQVEPSSNYLPYKADASWGSPRVLCLGSP